MTNNFIHNTTGLILAGGRARRMGGIDKGLVDLAGRPLIEWILAAVRPQTAAILINANRNHSEYSRYGDPVIADSVADYSGPLAGMAAGLAACQTDYLLTCPCDSPLLPTDLAARLHAQREREQAELAVAHNGERLQPVFALLSRSLLASLQDYLNGNDRKIDRWFSGHKMTAVDFSDQPGAFININTPEEVEQLASQLRNRPA